MQIRCQEANRSQWKQGNRQCSSSHLVWRVINRQWQVCVEWISLALSLAWRNIKLSIWNYFLQGDKQTGRFCLVLLWFCQWWDDVYYFNTIVVHCISLNLKYAQVWTFDFCRSVTARFLHIFSCQCVFLNCMTNFFSSDTLFPPLSIVPLIRCSAL